MTPPLVWLYKKGSKHGEYHRKSIEEAHYSQELKAAIQSGEIDSEIPVDLDGFGAISVILPKYHTNSLHDNVRAGSIVFFYNSTTGDYYAASLVLGTGRDKSRSFVGEIWPYDNPAKTYLVLATEPISIKLKTDEFRELFGYESNQEPLAGQKPRYFVAPGNKHQTEFERNIDSYKDFFASIRSSRGLQSNWVERKSRTMQEIASTWR